MLLFKGEFLFKKIYASYILNTIVAIKLLLTRGLHFVDLNYFFIAWVNAIVWCLVNNLVLILVKLNTKIDSVVM